MLVAAAVVAFLIALTALYVAAEFAAVGARRSRIRRLAEDGNGLAERMLPVLEDGRALDRYIAASQVGITLSSLILGAYGQATIAPMIAPVLRGAMSLDAATAQSAAAAIVLVLLTMVAMVLGELVPKSLALTDPTRTALATVMPMQWSVRLFGWSISFLNGSGNLLLKLLRVPANGHRHIHSPEEIDLLIAESRDGGLLEPDEQVRLHRALELSRRTAGELMVPVSQFAAMEISTPRAQVLELVAESPYSRLIAYRDSLDTIVGTIHTKDVVLDLVRNEQSPTAAALLRPIVRIVETMTADRVLAFLRERRTHQALVLTTGGAVAGLITLEDVLTELLGGVADEFKTTGRRRGGANSDRRRAS